jgi:hypothetical protein
MQSQPPLGKYANGAHSHSEWWPCIQPTDCHRLNVSGRTTILRVERMIEPPFGYALAPYVVRRAALFVIPLGWGVCQPMELTQAWERCPFSPAPDPAP